MSNTDHFEIAATTGTTPSPLPAVPRHRWLAQGVNVYVVSTGLDASLPEFAGRAIFAHDVFHERDWWEGGFDPHGHGTWLASLVGGETYGVTRGANLYGVRAFDAFGGTTQQLLEDAILWIAGNHVKPAVALLPFAFDAEPELDDAADRVVWHGVTVVTAGGDDATSGHDRSPARSPAVITVGAHDRSFNRAPWSANGRSVDLYAPGDEIIAAWPSRNGTKPLSGTASSTAIVAGAAAAILARDRFLTPDEVRSRLLADASPELPCVDMTGSAVERAPGRADAFAASATNDDGDGAAKTWYHVDDVACCADRELDGRVASELAMLAG